MKINKKLHSNIAWTSPEAIGVHGYDLCNDLMGEINFGDMAFLEVTSRLPNPNESRMFNAVLITLVEHGITPSSLATRMTYTGAPEAMQGAVAAGLLGLGSVFVGSTEGSNKMLFTALSSFKDNNIDPTDSQLDKIAAELVASFKNDKKNVPGIGHPIHKPLDPRTVRLFKIAQETGFYGNHIKLMIKIAEVASQSYKKSLPINATGAIGSICCEMGLNWKVSHGLGIMARAVGLVSHILEEAQTPIAVPIWYQVEEEATGHMRGKFNKKEK
jgi:citrate synthase